MKANTSETIERQFITFVVKTVIGIKKDHYLREQRRIQKETLFYTQSQCLSEPITNIQFEELLDECDLELYQKLRSLTDRQAFVLTYVLNGYTEKEIASILHISQQGVNGIRKRIFTTLNWR